MRALILVLLLAGCAADTNRRPFGTYRFAEDAGAEAAIELDSEPATNCVKLERVPLTPEGDTIRLSPC